MGTTILSAKPKKMLGDKLTVQWHPIRGRGGGGGYFLVMGMCC